MIQEFLSSVPPEIVRTGDATAPWRIHGVRPPGVVLPRTTEEAAAVLAGANERGVQVVVAGGGSRLGSGPQEGTECVVVSAAAMAEVEIYEPADLTLVAGAGVPAGRLSQILGEHGQMLPVDPPGWRDATLGGLVSRAEDGPGAPLYGRIKDLVLGLTLVTGDGRVLKVGGRVVKNVAGFDLTRLAVGGAGALGLVTEVAVRLFPRPASHRALRISVQGEEEMEALPRVLATLPFLPAGAEYRHEWRSMNDQPGLVLRFHGNEEAVEAMGDAVRAAFGQGRCSEVEPGLREDLLAESQRLGPTSGSPEGVGVLFRGLPSGAAALMGVARRLLEVELEDMEGRHLALNPLTGEIRIWIPAVVSDRALLIGALREARVSLESMGGEMAILGAPLQFHRALGRDLALGGAGLLVRKLRDSFDPGGIIRSRLSPEPVTLVGRGG